MIIFRLKPQPKLEALRAHVVGEPLESPGVDGLVHVPVAKPGVVAPAVAARRRRAQNRSAPTSAAASASARKASWLWSK